MQDELTRFLIDEFWILSWNASVQRALKYGSLVTKEERRGFRKEVIDHIQKDIISSYFKAVGTQKHLEHILAIRTTANSHVVGEKLQAPYNIGISQKLLNLQLKYLWCAGMIPMPPHCPVDRIILSHTRLKYKMAWTKINSLDECMDAISAIQEVAGEMPIAEWELKTFDRRG